MRGGHRKTVSPRKGKGREDEKEERYVWTLHPHSLGRVDPSPCLGSACRQRHISPPAWRLGDTLSSFRSGEKSVLAALESLLPSLRDTEMDPLLRRVMERGCVLVSLSPEREEAKHFLAETLAAIQHAAAFPNRGRGRVVRASLSGVDPCFGRRISSFFQEEILSIPPDEKGAWFRMRCALMDANSVAELIISSSESRRNVFFGGRSHAQKISSCLTRLGIPSVTWNRDAKSQFEDTPLEEVTSSFPFSALHVATSLPGSKGDVFFLLIGERHDETPMEKADEILSFLRSRCNPLLRSKAEKWKDKISLLIEKNVEDDDDGVEREDGPIDIPSHLSCDATDRLAIHRLRCDSVIVTPCERVRVRFVDNRHSDLSFLREEWISSFWDEDYPFRSHAVSFQTRAREDCLLLLSSPF